MNINEIGVSRVAATSNIEREGTGNPSSATTTSAAKHQPAQDQVSFSFTDHTVKALTERALQPLPARQAKIEELKQAVKTGEYKLDGAKIAQALLSASV